MQGNSEEWTEKYRPKTLRAVVGNEEAIEELKKWAEGVHNRNPKSKKAVILHGPPGCGKTSAAHALASERGWEVIELNASDKRSAGIIKKIVGQASTSNTFGKTLTSRPRLRLIILDEADNLHGNEDRGGKRAITDIVKRTQQPIILIANDKRKMGQALQRNSKVIEFKRIEERTIIRKVLKRICRAEGIEVENKALHMLIENANGDLRSAINDLHAISISKFGKITEDDIATGGRDVEEDISEVLKKIFGVEGYDMQEALSSLYSLDSTPDMSIQWIYKNFAYEHDKESFLHGLHYLSRADTFLGRVKRRENYKFWRYASSLMACGVLSAEEMQYAGKGGWQRKKIPSYFKNPWQRERVRGQWQGQSGEYMKSAPIREEIAKKTAEYCKVSRSYARFYVVPFLSFFFRDARKAAEITASLRLNVPQIAFLVSDADEDREEKAKRIYQDAYAIPEPEVVGEMEERVKRDKKVVEAKAEAEAIVEVEKGEIIELPEERKTVVVESEGKDEEEGEEEKEMKNQKTLTDFF
ncbi:MAG: replication factor C large subunit [Methanophagales archaeon]|nr:replication factor C large subunit [Methanophagales archaeon]